MNTLVDLLRVRASTSTQSITFLDEHGRVESALSYAELYPIALDVSRSLLSSGIVAGTTNVIIASFSDARSSVIAFWACCLGQFRPDSRDASGVLTVRQWVCLSALCQRRIRIHRVKLLFSSTCSRFSPAPSSSRTRPELSTPQAWCLR
jgi:hypothetical protein